MDFAELIAPVTPETFLSQYWGKRPLHVKATGADARADIMGWQRLNELLGIRTHWDAQHLKLVMNSRPVAGDHFLRDVPTAAGPRRLADPALVETFLSMGASLVANAVQDIAPEVRALTAMLGRRFAARVEANLYASFRDVQAFASHCDTHEVFAIHCAGTKRWRIYANRAENPTEVLEGDDAQARIDAAKGPVVMDVTLAPGDLLYIPRGFFHDAIASADASLHLTVGVLPHTGRKLFEMLEAAAMADPVFRAYLPDAREDDGRALANHVAMLMDRLAALSADAGFRDDIRREQALLADTHHATALPTRPALHFLARTDRAATIIVEGGREALRTAAGTQPLGVLADAARYMIERPAFSIEELAARFAHHPRTDLDALVRTAERLQLVQRYQPQR